MSLVSNLYKDHFLKEKSYWVPLANFRLREIRMIFMGPVIRKKFVHSHLTKHFTISISQNISLNPNMTFQIKMPMNWRFGIKL